MNNFISRVRTVLIAGAIFIGCFLAGPLCFGMFLTGLFVWLFIFEWVPLCTKIDTRLLLFTPLYPVFPMLSMLYLVSYYESCMFLPLYPFLLSWAGDTGAYLSGKSFGKHKICPSISPGKSWEGLAGGFLAITLVNWVLIGYDSLCSMIFIPGLVGLLFFSAVITIVGFFGDIFVSWLKRCAGVKDTGNLLPGHGGILDRFDSLFFIVLLLLFFI